MALAAWRGRGCKALHLTLPCCSPQDNGAPEQRVGIRTVDMPGSSSSLDLVVAKEGLRAGDVALRIPVRAKSLCVATISAGVVVVALFLLMVWRE